MQPRQGVCALPPPPLTLILPRHGIVPLVQWRCHIRRFIHSLTPGDVMLPRHSDYALPLGERRCCRVKGQFLLGGAFIFVLISPVTRLFLVASLVVASPVPRPEGIVRALHVTVCCNLWVTLACMGFGA